jgi:branched-chain amino acid transport system ATP-binding protein
MVLTLENVSSGYGPVQVLYNVTLDVRAGEVLCVLGRNGAGKSTLLKTIMGLVPAWNGTVTKGGVHLSGRPAHEVPRQGVGYIPQGRRLFSELTVAENLDIGLLTRNRGAATRTRVLDMFPRLRERLSQRAETLSGGEQQMLATARALCLEPDVLLLDEPTEGLQPSMIALIRDAVVKMRDAGVAVVLVEQRLDAVLQIADRVAFLENGHRRDVVDADVLRTDDHLLRKYVGV